MKATDTDLGKLHKQVALAFSNALAAKEEAQALLDEHGAELPDDVKAFIFKYAQPNPSLLTAAVKFLKDNDITCDVGDSAEMTDLQKRLQGKRKASTNVVALHDDE